jgi:hypothetical protein
VPLAPLVIVPAAVVGGTLLYREGAAGAQRPT